MCDENKGKKAETESHEWRARPTERRTEKNASTDIRNHQQQQWISIFRTELSRRRQLKTYTMWTLHLSGLMHVDFLYLSTHVHARIHTHPDTGIRIRTPSVPMFAPSIGAFMSAVLLPQCILPCLSFSVFTIFVHKIKSLGARVCVRRTIDGCCVRIVCKSKRTNEEHGRADKYNNHKTQNKVVIIGYADAMKRSLSQRIFFHP